MTMVGADVAGLREFARTLSAAATQLDTIRQDLARGATYTRWPGRDGDEFRNVTMPTAGTTLTRIASELRAGSSHVAQQANQQEQASAAGSSGSSGSRGAPSLVTSLRETWNWLKSEARKWFDEITLPIRGRERVDGGISLEDSEFGVDSIHQGSIGNCGTVASLGVISERDPDYLQDHLRRTDSGYEVTLYDRDGKPVVYYVHDVLDDGVRGAGDAHSWATIYEQALIQAGVLKGSGEYADADGDGDVDHDDLAAVYRAVTGAEGKTFLRGEDDYPTFEKVQERVRSGEPLVVGTYHEVVSDQKAREAGVEPLDLVEQHAYMVEGITADGSIVLVNPWGAGAGRAEDGGHRITINRAQYELYFSSVFYGPDRSLWKEPSNA